MRLVDLAKLGDPRDPDPLREYAILATAPDRVTIIHGEPAGARALRGPGATAKTATPSATSSLDEHGWPWNEQNVDIRGNRYKVPKFLHEEILRRPTFKDGSPAWPTPKDDPTNRSTGKPVGTCAKSPPHTVPSSSTSWPA